MKLISIFINILFIIVIYVKLICSAEVKDKEESFEYVTLSKQKCKSLINTKILSPLDCLIGTYKNSTLVDEYLKNISSIVTSTHRELNYLEEVDSYNNREECCFMKANKLGNLNFCDLGQLKENNTLIFIDDKSGNKFSYEELNNINNTLYQDTSKKENKNDINELNDNVIDKSNIEQLYNNNYTKICIPFDIDKYEEENLKNYNKPLVPCGQDIEITQSKDCFDLGNTDEYCCHIYGYLAGARVSQCYMFNKTIGRPGIFYSKEGLTYYCSYYKIQLNLAMIFLFIILLI